ncbi:MAG: HAD-IA family hydrolase [Polyangia bacterium]|jgi:phosphoglycolate phosphatase|nr:HAD-IA family hydrolase [Polyangia bacterium]
MTLRTFVVFDLDGTLCDTRGDIADAVNFGLAAQGLPPTGSEVITGFVGDGVGRLVDRVVEHVGGPLSLAPEVARALLAYYRDHPVVHTRPYPEVTRTLATLVDLTGRGLALASNKPTDLCEVILSHFGWRSMFSAVLGADWGGPRKPAPDVLWRLASLLGQPPEAGVMVGDSLMDLAAGRAAGLATVAALYGYRPPEELLAAKPDAAIEAPAELPAAFEAIRSARR